MRLALAQVRAGADIGRVVARAASEGAALVLFPESFSNGHAWDGDRAAWLAGAESLEDGPIASAYAEAAVRSGIHVAGTLLERSAGRLYNAAAIWGSGGDVLLHQRKRHICFFDAPEDALTAGEGSPAADLQTPEGPVRVGMMICMDREYPGPAADLAQAGAEIILVPNACPLVEDAEVGDVRVAGVRGLAFGHAVAVAVANYPEGGAGDGRSFCVDARGHLVAMAGPGEEMLMADIDLGALRDRRRREWFRHGS